MYISFVASSHTKYIYFPSRVEIKVIFMTKILISSIYLCCSGRTLRTSLNNTSFNFTYEITVTCYDDEAPDKIESQEVDTAGDVIIDVIFTDTATCTSSTVTTMSNKPLVQSQESTGYFDKPENIAFVSSLGGATVLLAGIAVIYRPAKRYLCKTASVENVVS